MLRFNFQWVNAIGKFGDDGSSMVHVEKSEVEFQSDDGGVEQLGGDGLVTAKRARSCVAMGV